MWHKTDYNKVAVHLLPLSMRKPVMASWVQLLVKPVASIDITWQQWRTNNLYRLEHTGQVCSLRKSLNDNFDQTEQRIYIGDGNVYNTLYIYTEAEAQNVYINDTLFLRTESETADSGLDFIVWVPKALYETQIYALKAHIDFYRTGGKRYAIYIING